ncbi:MAG: glycosyltransferase [Candidatus Margulisbacteria bacterium]|nr:glycosyltransferase [Candidatus Margulisiibacteriota bacterium]
METVIASGKVQDVENVFRGMVYRMAPDIVFIRCPDFVSLRIIKDLRIPKYFFVHDAFSVDPKYGFVSKKDFCSLGKDVRPIAVSAFLMNKLKAISKRKARLLYPFVDKKKFLAKRTGGDRITIMNNNPYKGKIIFESLAGLFPAYRFLACKGWGKDSGGANFKNLEHMDMTNDARRILSRTKILLCPSLIDDGYPRTIVEAFLNGIPVVANKVGGIPESIGDAGHLINVRPQRKMPLDRYCSDARLHRVAVVQYAKIIDKLMEDDSYYRLWSKTAEKAYFRIEGEYQLQYKGFLKEISSI